MMMQTENSRVLSLKKISRFLSILKEGIEILYYRLKVPFFEWKEQRWVKLNLYHDKAFKNLDSKLLESSNPYLESKVFPYGETPLRAFELMGKKANLTASDVFVDLGCGRGRGVFFLSTFFHCKGIGIDLTASFMQKARALSRSHAKKNVSFICKNFLDFDLSCATCIYLYGITYSDETLKMLEEKFKTLPLHSRILTIDEPLSSSLTGANTSSLTPSFQVEFNWGKADVFLYQKTALEDPQFTLQFS
ncbi:MAG: methyltransferase domain-containing protein [Candidatus Rhabdochlamydia sp.]